MPFWLFLVLSLLGNDVRLAAATRLKEPKRSEKLAHYAKEHLINGSWGGAFEIARLLREPTRTDMLNRVFDRSFEYGRGRGALLSAVVVADEFCEPERSIKLMRIVNAYIELEELDRAFATAVKIHYLHRRNAFEKIHEKCLQQSRYRAAAERLNPKREIEFIDGLMHLLHVSTIS